MTQSPDQAARLAEKQAATESWIFTFGSGQQHDGKFVVIPGTYHGARVEMLRHFGNAWSFQYPAADRASLVEVGMVEMPHAQWPAPAEAPPVVIDGDVVEPAEAIHEPTSSPTVLTFGAFNLPEARLSAYAKADDITDVIGDELSSAGYDMDTITMRFADGGRAVEVLDSNDEFVLGTVTISQPQPDYWLSLAEDLHRAAVRIAGLAGSGLPKPASVNLNILVSVSPGDAEQTVPVVDALAAAFGGTAGTDEQTTHYHSARLQLGAVKFHPYTFVPDREESELERLRAEVAELRAAQGGA